MQETQATNDPVESAATPSDTKPNGPVAAAFVAGGIGSAALGLFVILSELSSGFHDFIDFSTNFGLGSGVGPLSGKAILATIVFVVAWAILFYVWRGKEVDFNKMLLISLVLVGIGFALTFPPIFLLFG
jgi:hypothetical protein